jgi:hypothetical protein
MFSPVPLFLTGAAVLIVGTLFGGPAIVEIQALAFLIVLAAVLVMFGQKPRAATKPDDVTDRPAAS